MAMSILLTVIATIVALIIPALVANIWKTHDVICYGCRWAVLLWVGSFDIALFWLALRAGGYL
jgi:hypothetical protein